MGRLLGVGAGHLDGSAEILLKSAVRAAEGAGADVEMLRLDALQPRRAR